MPQGGRSLGKKTLEAPRRSVDTKAAKLRVHPTPPALLRAPPAAPPFIETDCEGRGQKVGQRDRLAEWYPGSCSFVFLILKAQTRLRFHPVLVSFHSTEGKEEFISASEEEAALVAVVIKDYQE